MLKRINEVALYAIGSKDHADVLRRFGSCQKTPKGRTGYYFCGRPAAGLDGLFQHGGQICLVCSGVRRLHEVARLTAGRCT
jgi:hypothetical protein